jgi:uncharacterized protein (DUF1778 family)
MATTAITLRVPNEDLAEIDRRTAAHGYPSRTAFMLAAALHDDLAATLTERQVAELAERLDELDERLSREVRQATAVALGHPLNEYEFE